MSLASCGNCPDAVILSLRNIVEDELNKVRSITELAEAVNRALQDVAALAFEDVQAILDAIPEVPVFDVSGILAYLTCPLTPLALLVDFDTFSNDLDPKVQLQRLKSLAKAEIDTIRTNFEDAINGSNFRQVIEIARRFVNEILRVRFDVTSFARAVTITATVFAVCGQEEYEAGPYLDFANEVQGFAFTGGLPASLNQNVAALVQRLMQAELKLKAAVASLV